MVIKQLAFYEKTRENEFKEIVNGVIKELRLFFPVDSMTAVNIIYLLLDEYKHMYCFCPNQSEPSLFNFSSIRAATQAVRAAPTPLPSLASPKRIFS